MSKSSPIKTRKPRNVAKPYSRNPKPKQSKSSKAATPRTSAKDIVGRENLTHGDWLVVFDYIHDHPNAKQEEIVEHFATLQKGALFFTQGTLSRNLKKEAKIRAKVKDNALELSSKRDRVVTRPDVEQAVLLWARHMEEKSEILSKVMLVAKRCEFEKAMNVPRNECLKGDGWVQSFCKA